LSYYPKLAILPYVLFLVTAAMLVGACILIVSDSNPEEAEAGK
jgi:hypothetical protein